MDGRTTRNHSIRHGFTLIELLVVVSIIALLIAILLPAIGKAKVKAGTVACSSRMHALGIAMATYLAEFDQRFPINGLLMPKPNVPSRYLVPGADPRFAAAEETTVQKWRLEFGALWSNMHGTAVTQTVPNLPFPSVEVAKAFLCPNDTFNRTYNANASIQPLTLVPGPAGTSLVKQGPGNPGYWSYSVNAVLNSLGRFRNNFPDDQALPWIDPISYPQIRNPSSFIFFIEEDEGSLFNDEVMDAPAFGGGDRLTNRHDNGGNLAFGDGHVEWVSEVQFDQGGSNPSGVAPQIAIQSPWTGAFFPDGGEFAH